MGQTSYITGNEDSREREDSREGIRQRDKNNQAHESHGAISPQVPIKVIMTLGIIRLK